MKRTKIPMWYTAARIGKSRRTPIENFVHDFEPLTGKKEWRQSLSQLLEYEKTKAIRRDRSPEKLGHLKIEVPE